MVDSATNNAFEWPVRVYYEDTDMQGVVYYANYFRFMERARTEWLRALGVEQDALLESEGTVFVVTETRAEFIKPAQFNDQLVVTAALDKLSRASFTIQQNIFRSGANSELLCRGWIRAACINAQSLRPVRIPKNIFEDDSQ